MAFYIAQVVICVLLIVTILLQRPKVALNLSTMSGSMWKITRRWPEKVLHNATIVFAIAFIVNSLILALR